MESKDSVYLAAISTTTPQLYPADQAIETFYPKEKVSRKVYRMAQMLGRNIAVQNRAMIIAPDVFPEKKLKKSNYRPKCWGLSLLDKVSESISLADIGHITVAYNVTSHREVLPNLACQIAMEAGLDLDSQPTELAYYGCSAGILALNEAIKYCQKHNRAAFVYVFDQCTWINEPVFNSEDPNFRASLRTHLLFSDGGVGMLLVPERMREKFSGPLMKFIDSNQGFRLGNVIKMEESKFLVGKGVAETMPALVTEESIKPLLEKNCLGAEEVSEWSLHQGGLPVLDSFKSESLLGLSEEQIRRSKDFFIKYGNFSAPSCLYVLNSFFHEKQTPDNSLGVVASFGAGYYFGSLLYQNVKN